MKAVAVVFVLLALDGGAAAQDARAVAALVQKSYGTVRDFKAAFEQEYLSKALGRRKRSSGYLYVKRPDKMRWDYREPNPKHFLINGRTLYIYDPELNQVIVDRHFVSSQLTAAVSFLWGRGRLEEGFHLALERYPGVDPEKFWVLELRPRGPAQFTRMLLVLEKPRAVVRRSIIEDPGGNVNVIRFSRVSVNVGLKDQAFEFTIPKGVDVVEVPGPD